MKNIGIIDIGSNSMRSVLIEIFNGNCFRIIDEAKATVRLGMDVLPDGSINPIRMQHAFNSLQSFKSCYEAFAPCEIYTVATEAIRKASNQNEFLNMAKAILDSDVRILTGEEEAYYDYFGVVNSIDIESGLIMDIGGCSTEIIWFDNRKIMECVSLPIGAINITKDFNLYEAMSMSVEKKLMKYINSRLNNIPWLSEAKDLPLIGIGGTVRNLGKISRKNNNYLLDKSHNYRIPSEEVISIYNSIKLKNLDQRKKIKGLSSERADIFSGASSIAAAVIGFCRNPDFIISGCGLKEGLLFEILNGQDLVSDILDHSLENAMETLKLNKAHRAHICKSAQKIFLQTESIHKINRNVSKILKTASMLCDCGKIINLYDYHKHTFYMILNLPINGLSHKEIIMAAYTAVLSIKENYCLENSQFLQLLTGEDIEIVQKLSVILRLAKSMEGKNDKIE